jgi:menaquinone-specific isochorismate synthase
MTFAGDPRVVWSHGERTLLGYDGDDPVDPGNGPDRYQKAAEALRESGKDLAFASFTFDPEEPGSVVVIPDEVVSITARGIPKGQPASLQPEVVSDGIEEWRQGLSRALVALESGEVEKVVLARRTLVELGSEAHLPSLAEKLRLTGLSSYTFLVEGLVGCSPELLVSLRAGRLSSLALAGTAAEVGGLSSDLKEREHQLAVESVREGVEPHLRVADEEQREALVYGTIHHLGTRLGGLTDPGVTVSDVLATLHPTAGVAGTPRDRALRLIRDIEPETRGRYAGPVGWFRDTGEGEFAIALRCGQFDGARVTLHAGGGIVAGANPDEELAETDLKLAPMRSALGLS